MTSTLRVSVGLAGAAGVSTGGDAASIQLRRFFCYETHASEEFVQELDSLVTGERQLIHIKVDFFFSSIRHGTNNATHILFQKKRLQHTAHTRTPKHTRARPWRENGDWTAAQKKGC